MTSRKQQADFDCVNSGCGQEANRQMMRALIEVGVLEVGPRCSIGSIGASQVRSFTLELGLVFGVCHRESQQSDALRDPEFGGDVP